MRIEIPGGAALEVSALVLDVNGTLTARGDLLEGVRERLAALAGELEIHLLSADTFGTLERVTGILAVPSAVVANGREKARFVETLGAGRCVAIGNGVNDRAMLEAAVLGIAVVGPEGAAASALAVADIVCLSITDALDLLLEPRALVATLRA